MKLHRLALTAMSLSLLALPASTLAADGTKILKSECAGCHALTEPDEFSLDRLWERKGPDLFYAGVKYNQPWLVKWLQNPTRIRPAGEFYRKHIKPSEKVDVIDESTLEPHMKLSQEDAKAVADALMALKGPEGLVEEGGFKGKKVRMSLGRMFFGKLRGCSSCHQDKPGKGGLSGPELYTAGERLQPDYIYSYIKDPQKIDPYIWMPKFDLSEKNIQQLTGYIVQLSAKEKK